MRTRTAPEHQDVVHRRLELLRAELAKEWAGAESDPAASDEDTSDGDGWWSGHTAVPGADDPAADVTVALTGDRAGDGAGDGAGAVPVPGRHAARRRLSLDLPALVPEPVRGRIGMGPWQLVVVALAVAVGLAVTCWWLIRSDSSAAPAPIPASAATSPLIQLPGSGSASASPFAPEPGSSSMATPAAAPGTSPGTSPGASSDAASGATVTVDVEGKVHRPGIAVLPAGSRVIDALHAAGGPRKRSDLTGLNLAAVLSDGQQIVVGAARSGTPPAVGDPVAPGGASDGASGVPTTLVNLNTATVEELEALPDVGPVTAQSIVDWREQNGGFTSVDELLQVDGIGDKTLAKLTPYVTV